MNQPPTLFGFPLWDGHIKKRVAKKYLNRWSIGKLFKRKGHLLSNHNVGDMVSDCTGFNGVITELEPNYRRVTPNGWVLSDISLTTENIGCSLVHCGIMPACPREEIESDYLESIRHWGVQSPKYQAWLDTLEAGGHITDEQGRLLVEFK